MRAFLAAACLLFAPLPGFAFMPNPDLLTVAPAVAKTGTTFEMTTTGKELEGAKTLRFSHPKITAAPVMLPADDFYPTPRPAEGRFTVTIPAEVEPGVYEVRSHGYFGLSTARPFVVFPSGSAEITETGDHSTAEAALPIEAGSGVLGTLDAGRFDWYRFAGKKDERLLLEVLAERLDAKGDVLMAVYDAAGRELENSRHHFGRDPFIDFTPPADGEYFVSLSDALYGGGREFFYHLRLSRGPHVDFVFPPAGEPGKNRAFTFFGRNLPNGSLGENWSVKGKPLETLVVSLDVPTETDVPATFSPAIPRQSMVPAFEHTLEGANAVHIGFATAPVVEEDSKSELQTVVVPAEIAGRFDKPGDVDQFRISLKKGTTYWIDVICHRLGVVADPVVTVEKITKDADGKETYAKVASNDDLPSFYSRESLDDLNADSLDPALSLAPDADAEYRIILGNQSGGGSAAHLYRLAIREARPDFQLITGTEFAKTINNDAFPASPVLRRGGSVVYRVIAFRRDGFEGEITVTAAGLPAGVTAKPLILGGASSQGFLTFWAAPDAAAWTGQITISGTAKVAETDLVRKARPASIIWGKRVFGNQAQVRSRLDLETVLSVLDQETEPTRIALAEDKVWTVELGQTLTLPIKLLETGNRTGSLAVNVHGFPGLLRGAPTINLAEQEKEGIVTLEVKKTGNFEVGPGRYQFVLQGVGNAKYSQNPDAAAAATAEVARLKGLKASFTDQAAKAKATLESAEKTLGEVKQREAAAADDVARAAMKGEVTAAQGAVDAAKKTVQAAGTKLQTLATVEEAAVKSATALEAKAKERSQQFATYSMPITVEVTAPVTATPGKK
jgi:hypothetical protein